MSARGVMVLGTASHVGKSLLTAAFCRILRDDGYRVAPFKAQNMSLNSAATPEGGEIGRAQALQAEAAGIAPSVDMNPVLVKPTSDRRSQVVVAGKIWGVTSASEYHRRRIVELFPLVCEAYDRLAARYDVVVLEGAGSPAEINLRESDLVNMRMAHAADARCVLAGDIDRGGVFAALYGTLALLDDEDRARIVGTIVNKFRGDVELLRPGLVSIEARMAKPCFGVVPYLRDIGLEEEDGVAFDAQPRARDARWRGVSGDGDRALRVAIVAWPLVANVTDFDALEREPSVELCYASTPQALAGADVVIVPGTKSTLAAIAWLDANGFVPALRDAARRAIVVGICGGMQALGERVDDPFAVEGGGSAAGLGLLPLRTTLARVKVAERARGTSHDAHLAHVPFAARPVDGYEIHVGETTYAPGARRFARIVRASDGATLDDGARSADGRVLGTYLHGLFVDDAFRGAFVDAARAASALSPARARSAFSSEREASLDRLAAHVRASVDMPRLLAACGVA
ncbi:MAG: cobyric acid synthase [Vulcanimicrobiaceae bacterium]